MVQRHIDQSASLLEPRAPYVTLVRHQFFHLSAPPVTLPLTKNAVTTHCIDRLEVYDLLTLTLLFLPVLSVLLPLELFVYLRLITGTLFLCISAHLTVGSRALSFSDPYFHFACLSVLLSFCHSVVLSVRNFGAKYLGNEAR